MTKKTLIEFIDTTGETHESLAPRPAKRVIPDWYKKMEGYAGDFDSKTYMPQGLNPSTIKRCVPVFDAMTAGYILVTPQDVAVEQGRKIAAKPNTDRQYRWPTEHIPIEFHSHDQAEGHPYAENQKDLGDIPKWLHPWAIRTPKGYSCLFIPPVHRDSPFRIMEGVVDTDSYNTPVHFPFTFIDPHFTGLIPAGTPMAQVIPFKRENYEHAVLSMSTMADNPVAKTRNLIRSRFFNAYRKVMWEKKDYS